MSLILYQLEGCPYCERVAERMEELNIKYSSVWVASLHSERDEVKRISGQRLVPVLIDEEFGVTMAESDQIINYLDTAYA